jgi:hypothetical protein
VKVIARPDPQMVEVPLEFDAELPREFEGTAQLTGSGLPRKVHLNAQRDRLKLSTAYRADQLVADIARVALRAQPAEVERAQAAVRAFVRAVRERRPEGATLLIESNGRGKLEVTESGAGEKPPEPPRPPQRDRPAQPDLLRRIESRLAALETRLAGVEDRPPATPLEPREAKRASFPRERAIDGFAERLRAELRKRVAAQLEAASRDSSQPDRAAAADASARVETLRRLLDEIDLYPAHELPLAELLVARLAQVAPPPDEAPAKT